MFYLGLAESDALFIKVGIGAIILVIAMIILLFYKLDQVDKEYEERERQRQIKSAARREELQRKKEESLRELLKRQEERNRWKTRRD